MAPVCAQCDENLSVEHILVPCSKYDDERRNFNLMGKSLGQIVCDEADVNALVDFLKAIGLFNLI